MATTPLILLVLAILCPFLLEAICLIKNKRSFHVTILNHCLKAIISIARELKDDDKGKFLCGVAIAVSVFALVAFMASFMIVNMFQHNWTMTFITLSLLIITPVPVLLGLQRINHSFIAFNTHHQNQ
ncbi:MAG: hypothetical protein NTV16_00060 [Actinobacteria bacterium]|nr:hypothetical protein [Actinomycetota bacterium]